jgi:hypothetical protein
MQISYKPTSLHLLGCMHVKFGRSHEIKNSTLRMQGIKYKTECFGLTDSNRMEKTA